MRQLAAEMMKLFQNPGWMLLGLVLVSSCGPKVDPNRKATSPVTGKVTVDGKAPGSPLKIICHNLEGLDKQNPTFSWCLTDKDGTFTLNTYEAGDGVPVGKYALTFLWGKWNPISNSYGGKDQWKDRYSIADDSKMPIEVDGSGPVDLGTIALTTK
jgi:hypothetical protein